MSEKRPEVAEFPAIAKKLAEELIAKVPEAYASSVQKNLKYYEPGHPPNADDFFAWLEGYDWRA